MTPALLTDWFTPRLLERAGVQNTANLRAAVIIPTYGPTPDTVRLAKDLLRFDPRVHVILVDDSTPYSARDPEVYRKLSGFERTEPRFFFTQTKENKFKAGAANRGLEYIAEHGIPADVVIVSDDDVYVQPHSVRSLVATLYRYHNVAAVCTLLSVKNKNQNLLTRLQSLEYHGFNISKIADNSFLSGPLVIQGMFSAFKYGPLTEVGGYTAGHLIEDYDLTARLKKKGYRVIVANDDSVATLVPATFLRLWKQRVRWGYGGLRVINDHYRSPLSVFQDLFGHGIYIVLVGLIITSFFWVQTTSDRHFTDILLIAASIQFLITYIFGLISLRSYRHGDAHDVLLKTLVFPELLYSTVFSLVLLGAYAFFLYNKFFARVLEQFPRMRFLHSAGLVLFRTLGFSAAWGTK